jgi:NitT/TauT family transport system permease protein
MLRHPFAPRDAVRTVTPHRIPSLLADAAVLLGTLALFALIARVGAGAFVRFVPPHEVPSVSLDPHYLPYYAARSTLRMFLALGASLLFTLIYGYVAAKSRRAERMLIPLLDVLQSVPVLGFLSITVTGFIALFPGSLLGLELASIFAIFTSQAWNMTFSFYQSLRTVPRELDEAVMLYRLPRWQRFLRLEVPAATIGLLWNAMMSFGGGWFFVAASEAISVLNQSYTLPGIGSYVTTAVEAQDIPALLCALVAIAVVIMLVDQLFWRPLVAWGDRFKLERSAAAEAPHSWLLDILRSARLPHLLAGVCAPVRETLSTTCARLFPARVPRRAMVPDGRHNDRLYNALLVLLAIGLGIWGVHFILAEVGLGEMGQVLLMGLATFARVAVLVVLSTVLWVPIGVAIGFTPRLARLLQPVVQFLASFPANFLFPFATIAFIKVGLSLNIGSIVLMALGAQWYILFNTVAGAMSISNDLREMARNLGVRG